MAGPGSSRRERILEALELRLQAIRLDSADPLFATDAGLYVYLGTAPEFSDDDTPEFAVALLVGDDAPKAWPQAHAVITLPVLIASLAKVTGEVGAAWRQVEAVLADIKRAIEGPDDRRLGGLLTDRMERGPTRTLERDPGTRSVGAALTYILSYQERWGAPEQ